MKKLALAAIVAFAAVCVQAASVSWSYSSKDASVKGATIYMVVGDTAPTAISDWATWVADQTVVSQKTLGYNAIKGSTGTDSPTASNITKDQSYYFVMLDADGKNFKTTGAFNGTDIVYDTAAQEPQISTNISSAFGSSWTEIKADTPTTDVPEPTSGLLLLVGAAAMALRRRRA